jgi:hypothetical protein
MTKYLFLFLLPVLNSSDIITNDCRIVKCDSVCVENINHELIGEWAYTYSIYNDSCFLVSELIELPALLAFQNADTAEMKLKFPKLVSFGRSKYLFGLVSYLKRNDQIIRTYPISESSIKKKCFRFLQVTHFAEVNGIGKVYDYYIKSINGDTLVVSDAFGYTVGGKNMFNMNHIYIKKGNRN